MVIHLSKIISLSGSQLSNFTVGTMNISVPMIGQYSVCTLYGVPAATGGIITVICFNSTDPGSHVFVQLGNRNYLQICEVEVYGTSIIV